MDSFKGGNEGLQALCQADGLQLAHLLGREHRLEAVDVVAQPLGDACPQRMTLDRQGTNRRRIRAFVASSSNVRCLLEHVLVQPRV